MEFLDSCIVGCKVFTPSLFGDNRGLFYEMWNQSAFINNGIDYVFVQDTISTSLKGVLRGIHTQLKYPQAKIVSCLGGAIFDVAVDCRPQSPTLGKWYGEVLSQDNHKQLLIPEGVAHGFYTLEDAMVFMKVTTHYTPGDEIGFMWNDSEVGIEWPHGINPILAEKDKKWGSFSDMIKVLEDYR